MRSTWVKFAGYVPLASQNWYPIKVYSVANYTGAAEWSKKWGAETGGRG